MCKELLSHPKRYVVTLEASGIVSNSPSMAQPDIVFLAHVV